METQKQNKQEYGSIKYMVIVLVAIFVASLLLFLLGNKQLGIHTEAQIIAVIYIFVSGVGLCSAFVLARMMLSKLEEG